jgi:hypothetical protein
VGQFFCKVDKFSFNGLQIYICKPTHYLPNLFLYLCCVIVLLPQTGIKAQTYTPVEVWSENIQDDFIIYEENSV